MKIYLIRHGKVENPDKILYSRLPGFHLSKIGIAEVQKSAEKLEKENAQISKIYTSPMERALETSDIIARFLNISPENIIKSDALIEVDDGKYQGVSLAEYKSKIDEIWESGEVESPQKASLRIFDFINSLPKEEKEVVIVSHGDPIMGIICKLNNDWGLLKSHYIHTGDYFVLENSSGSWKVE